MAPIAEFTFPSKYFALAETLPQFPEVTVEAAEIVAHAPDTTMPCLWASGPDLEEFGEAMAADPTVEEIRATASFDGEVLYHLTWSDEIQSFVTEMIDHEGVILEASGRADRWRVRLRFMTREQFDSFQTEFAEGEPELRLERLFQAELPRHRRGHVTPEQYRALATATELGYYQVPRQASIRDVAAELDVSHQAVSERLRRGVANLVADTLLRDLGRDDRSD